MICINELKADFPELAIAQPKVHESYTSARAYVMECRGIFRCHVIKERQMFSMTLDQVKGIDSSVSKNIQNSLKQDQECHLTQHQQQQQPFV